jgi:hypothetical protein
MSYEFDQSEYPLRAVWYIDSQTPGAVRLPNGDEPIMVSGLAEPRIEPLFSDERTASIAEPSEGINRVGTVACRMLSQEGDLVTLEFPTIPEATVVTVAVSSLARKR